MTPPLGLRPKEIHEEKRIEEIIRAMHRYVRAREKIPVMWFRELTTLTANLKEEA